MRWRLLSKEASEKIFLLVLDPGEEAFTAISDFASANHISAASLIAIGAFEKAVVGWYDFDKRDYRRIPVEEQCEVLSLIGDIASGEDGKASLHAHVVLGLSDGTTRGGHFLEGTVKPTLEVTLSETPAHLRRKPRPDLGIALIDP
ncbi:DNA-binding protein [Sinorhizobium numidicum]|uniref:DNA-binding protein n=1 Tax=Sinorhizobium numidicum TaxID=680248 RepID=A0ABY8CMC3_9HYPH|nr:PPC domain-containing DNA-binding protein [Sinorhizobium numidicum]WEX73821.1 DNA-binding protein [Sinorhizobium numidicum]WEX79806.1 DNA-binding protein [Sinorhizobium numidicum]